MIEISHDGETLVDRAAVAFAGFQAGDRRCLDELIELMTPMLWQLARSQGADHESSEDILQTVWLSLLRNAGSVRDPQTIVKWLLTTTRREAWRVVKNHRASQTSTTTLETPDGAPRAGLPVQREGLPEDLVVGQANQDVLWTAVAQLPQRCQVLLRVIAFADRPDYAQIAESLGMPMGSIGPTRGRCLAKLRATLAHDPAWEN